MSIAAPRLSPVRFGLLLALLLVGHAGLTINASRHLSTTNDEIAHLASGYAFNTYGDYRVQPENGVLPQRWHALPLVWTNPQFPNLTSDTWTQGLAYRLSYDFFYKSGNDPDALLLAGRTANVVWGVGVILLIALVGRRLWGPLPALWAAAMAALSPTLLAHSALATSDMAMTFFFLASTLAFWEQSQRGTWAALALSCLTFGLACVAKFNAVFLLPMLGLLALLRLRIGPPVTLRQLAGQLLLHGIAAWGIIWTTYGFRFSMMSPEVPAGTMPLGWEYVLSEYPGWDALIGGLRDYHILPEAFLYGFAYVIAFSGARGAFLDGEVGVSGWVEFFPKTFLYKTPGAELLMFALAAVALLLALRRSPARLHHALPHLLPWAVLFVVYWFFSLTSHLNIGHRHILPTYPLLWLLGGGLLWWALRDTRPLLARRAGIVAAIALLLGQAVTTVGIHPHHLAFFNAATGGPIRGYQHLVDSSLDWGQSLPSLQHWAQARPDPTRPFYLAYFGTGEPAAYGIEATLLTTLPKFNPDFPWTKLEPGSYAISATLLQQAYRQKYRPWNAAHERLYQDIKQSVPALLTMDGAPEAHPELLGTATAEEWRHAWEVYTDLRFARLCAYLRNRPPEAMAGYAILIFELDATELEQALEADLGTLANAVEAVGRRPFTPVIY